MEIDSSPLKPRDRIVRRLVNFGVPEELVDYSGIVNFAKNNESLIPELVSTILPTDVEVAEVIREAKARNKRVSVGPNMKARFRESMVWLQWLMFEGEPDEVLKMLAKIGQRGVCGAVWGKNNIAYTCRTCAHDPTCVICVPCFQNGNHKDHDYSSIYTIDGCCDCGDVTAWKREGFCSKHKGAEQIQPLPEEFANSVGPILDALFICWRNKLSSAEAFGQDSPRVSDRVAELRKVANELTFSIVEMLLEFCKHSESLLTFVSKRVISLVGLLEILVKAERLLCEVVVKKLRELLLKLLGEPIYKYEFAKVFLSCYPDYVNKAIRDCSDDAIKKCLLHSSFSVQIFTVPTLTSCLVKEMNLLETLLGCLGDIFAYSAGDNGCLQVLKWANLHATTTCVIRDIQCVMSHVVVSEYATNSQQDISRTWMRILTFVQGMNPQKRETGIHVEVNECMQLLLRLDHSIANMLQLVVDGAFSFAGSEEMNGDFNIYKQGAGLGDSLRRARVGHLAHESSVCGAMGKCSSIDCTTENADVVSDAAYDILLPPSVTWLTHECLRAVENWLGVHDFSSSAFLPDVLPPNTSSISGKNFLASKETLSTMRKDEHIFSRLNGSGEVPVTYIGTQKTVDLENAKNTRKDIRTAITGECDTVACSSAGSDESAMDGECAEGVKDLCTLSLCYWPDIVYDVSSQDVSVHIPLHRLLSLILQKALRRCYGKSAVQKITSNISENPLSAVSKDFFGHVLRGFHPYGFSAFIMEHPLQIRVFCAQVHAGMWHKSGDTALLSCEWYRSGDCSEQALELDLFLLQCCAALAPADLYVNRIIERFGLSNYLSLTPERSNEYEPVLVQEMLTLIIQIIQERRFCGLTTAESLKRELVHKLAVRDATRSQLVESLPCDLSKFDQLQEVLDTVALYLNPSRFNQGMYSLRPTYWKELDLYHPCWSLQDLQVAEERYMHFCNVSGLITQLPRWTKIYHPLEGIASVATCKMVLKVIRAVLFYAVFTDKVTESRAPYVVLLAALHLLALALDICILKSQSCDQSCEDSTPMLAFAGEEISEGLHFGAGKQSLLSLLVLLMGMHKKENVDSFLEAGNCNLSSLIESLLAKFAEFDSRCMIKLQQLAPEVVSRLSKSSLTSGTSVSRSTSDSEKRKAKAREKQTAILEKMKAAQFKFLSDMNSNAEVTISDMDHDSEESVQDVCSLCHDRNSKNPVSYLILLQKSRLLSFVDRGPPSWEQVHQTSKEHGSITMNKVIDPCGTNTSSISRVDSPSKLEQMADNTVKQYCNGKPGEEVMSILEFVRAHFPLVRNFQVPCASSFEGKRIESTLEMFEQDMYHSIRRGMHANISSAHFKEDEEQSAAKDGLGSCFCSQSVMLGKYVAALSTEMRVDPSAFETSRSNRTGAESTSQLRFYDGFSPLDYDGIYLSSCGHAVHQNCLDRYLSSLEERYNRRIIFEGGHNVDPDKGEFLCPVCRQLANCVLPVLPGDFEKVYRQPMISSIDSSLAANSLSPGAETNSLWLQQALSLLQSAANVVAKGVLVEAFPLQINERMVSNLEPVSHVISKMYFQNKQNSFSGSARVSHSMIMWDTLKYSLMSMEVAARCARTSMTPIYDVDALYKELKSPSGFVLSLLLKVVQSMRSKSSLHVLQRFRGIQLFAESICSGVSTDCCKRTCGQGGSILSILKHVDKEVLCPDIQFWSRASDPVLARDPFSSLMWVLFCLPCPFISCEKAIFSLVHLFYAVALVQALIAYFVRSGSKINELGFCDHLITDISRLLGKFRSAQEFFVSNYIDPSCDVKDMIRKMTFPYLRRCALLWKLLNSSASAPFSDRDNVLDQPSHGLIDMMDSTDGESDLSEIQKLEKMFKIPPLDAVLRDEVLHPLVLKWFHQFSKESEVHGFQCILHSNPAVPFRLMQLPYLYQELLQRYIKQSCPGCKNILDEPALCLLCGTLCSPSWKSCCRKSGCQAHARACGAGTGVFLLIRRTTILLQRCNRQAPWPSLYLDAFGEEDIGMRRGKPLYLNEERYAAIMYMVASHGLDRSSKVTQPNFHW